MAPNRADDPLRELRRADRPRARLRMRALRRRVVDAGYEEDGGNGEPPHAAGAGVAADPRARAREPDRSRTARHGKMVGVEIWNANTRSRSTRRRFSRSKWPRSTSANRAARWSRKRWPI